MPIATLILTGTLAIVSKVPVQLTVDFSQITTGSDYRITIKLFDSKGIQKGNIQTVDLGAAADVDVILRLVRTAIRNTGLTATLVAGTTKLKITGAAADFKRIEYSTSTKEEDDWVPNTTIKGPTVVGKPGKPTPSFVVNPKPF